MDFPILDTGVVQQYPASRAVTFATRVLRFTDGSEQRYRSQARGLRSWRIDLSLLNERETYALREFFRAAKGRQGSFSFHDPWTDTTFEDCSLDGDIFDLEVMGEMRGRTALIVRENP